MITPLPPAPSTNDPATFQSRADAILAALPNFIVEANALGTDLFIVLRNYLTGLTLSTVGSSATFSIATGQAADSTNAALINFLSAYTKTTAAWALGTGNGALDTGSIANNTWYHVWLIERSDTGVADILISTSATAPTMPTSYDRKRRIGSMRTNGSAQWYKFAQDGDLFLWDAPVGDYDAAGAQGATTGTNIAVTTPPGVKTLAKLRGFFSNATLSAGFLLESPNAAASTIFTPRGNFTAYSIVANRASPFTCDIQTNTSQQIRLIADTGSSDGAFVTYGWIDARGKS